MGQNSLRHIGIVMNEFILRDEAQAAIGIDHCSGLKFDGRECFYGGCVLFHRFR